MTLHAGVHDHEPTSPLTPLDEEIFQAEANFERYGGDDIHEPEPKFPEHGVPSPSATLAPASTSPDPNMVTWDGPDDPTNPQNWSIGRKWFITIVCGISTLNV